MMNPYDLAWKGTTVEEKRALLEHAKIERDRRIKENDAKNGHLGLASTCVDIIGTAKSVINESESSLKDRWNELLEECLVISKDAVIRAEKEKDIWTPNDHEIAGIIYIYTAKEDPKALDHAVDLFKEGIQKARTQNNTEAEALLLAKLVKADMAKEDYSALPSSLMILHKAVEEKKFDLKTMTRLYQTLAEGAKFLAIQLAKDAGSENQVLKAKSI